MDDNSYYDGSRLFTRVAKLSGLSVDLVNFLLAQVLALVLASLFRSYLHPTKVSAGVRHAFGLVIGLCSGYFCFGQQAIHIAGLPIICYVVIRTQNPQIVQRMVMVVALTYLSCVHLHRQYYDYGSLSLDITGPLMIITQKVTSLAFSIHDGLTREEKDLTTGQKTHAVQKIPTPLEFFSYVLHFQGLMAGPMVFYKDYIEFIEGYHILKHAPGTNGNADKSSKQLVIEPSPVKAVVKKVAASLICATIFMKFITVYPIKAVNDEDFLKASALSKFWFMIMATTIIRFKYYHAWLLADAICNNSGLGFNGYDKDGQAKWDLISNINVISFELGTNFRDSINNWNMGTNRWLRSVVFERVPRKYGTIFTFSLSALWHGFYPGYYITFSTGALFVMAARSSRRLFRHRFQSTAFMRNFYDILTCLVTRVFMGYATFPFVFLEFMGSIRVYLRVFMCLHIVAVVTIFALPKIVRGEQRSKISSSNSSTIKQENEMSSRDNNSCKLNNSNIPDRDKICVNGMKMNGFIDSENNITKENDNLSYFIKEKIENEARNIEELFDKTFTGIVELKEDLMKINDQNGIFISSEGLRKRYMDMKSESGGGGGGGVEFIKKEIDALNAAVQQVNVLPAVLSNGHAK